MTYNMESYIKACKANKKEAGVRYVITNTRTGWNKTINNERAWQAVRTKR